MSLLGDLKEIGDLARKAGNIDLLEKIVDLRSHIVELTEESLKLKTELREKDQRIAELERAFETKAKFVRGNDCYFESDENGKRIGYPYCSRCWEVDQKAVHLVRTLPHHHWQCPECKSNLSKNIVGF